MHFSPSLLSLPLYVTLQPFLRQVTPSDIAVVGSSDSDSGGAGEGEGAG